MSREEPAKETLKDLIGMIPVEGLEKGILKGELCMRQPATNAAIGANFHLSQQVESPFTAAIALERMNILNPEVSQVLLQENLKK